MIPVERIARLEKAVSTMAWWLVQAQTGFGVQDARGIEDILATGDFDHFKQAVIDGEDAQAAKSAGDA